MSRNAESENHTPEVTGKKRESARTERVDLPDSCYSQSVCSATDCTGLIPALPSSEDELESYEEMYQFCLKGTTRRNTTADGSLRV